MGKRHPPNPSPPIRCKILVFSAGPSDADQLSLQKEVRDIRLALRSSGLRESFSVETRHATQAQDIIEEINYEDPDIVHICCHGVEFSGIVLEDDSGHANEIPAALIKDLFSSTRSNIKVILLNGCYTNKIAKGITSVIDCAIGMKGPIFDPSALVFATVFYKSIGRGKSIKQAFDQATAAARASHPKLACHPQIHFRAGLNKDALYIVSPLERVMPPVKRQVLGESGLSQPTAQIQKTSGNERDTAGKSESVEFNLPAPSSCQLYVPLENGERVYYRCNAQQVLLRRLSDDWFLIVSHPQPTSLQGKHVNPKFKMPVGDRFDFVIHFFLENRHVREVFVLEHVSPDTITASRTRPIE